jgi:hypothetical protein
MLTGSVVEILSVFPVSQGEANELVFIHAHQIQGFMIACVPSKGLWADQKRRILSVGFVIESGY